MCLHKQQGICNDHSIIMIGHVILVAKLISLWNHDRLIILYVEMYELAAVGRDQVLYNKDENVHVIIIFTTVTVTVLV